MTTTHRAPHPALVRLLLVLAVAAGLTVPHVATAPSASATVPAATGVRAVTWAATRAGAVYKVGAVGPHAFDCSGLTLWAYAHSGKHLPRSAQQQWLATAHISAASRRPGDLVFFFSGSRAYHVAIYAGHNQIWHAPKRGDRVKKVLLWTTKVRYGRVR